MLPYRLSARAEADLDAVRRWYDQIRVTLGDRVVDAVFDVIRLARERPESFPEVGAGVRVGRCGKFPYRVFFAITDEGVNVLAVYHTARDPQRWDDPNRE
ncbi:MAG: type II toxin-antitoxin system RelE/ParE family toxin [Tepidisphaeraceae bacterium]